ncbi:unnamed protein product [Caenorhabditis bovis]|uniref:T20D4.11-like domain-containing protein n=1 Tax=Caenorhabditis bovis TaxID=2654633 RepID=A0A8S1F6F4_9PELO|nr:unnamed protein product [Caenorhabditis bovis]
MIGEKSRKNAKGMEDGLNDGSVGKNVPLPVCEDFYGKEDCLKKETIAICGTNDWNQMRSSLITLTNKERICAPPPEI